MRKATELSNTSGGMMWLHRLSTLVNKLLAYSAVAHEHEFPDTVEDDVSYGPSDKQCDADYYCRIDDFFYRLIFSSPTASSR